VYNFAEMTRDEVRELLVRTEGRVCARLYQRADGTVLTRDCPTGLRAIRQRTSRIAAAVIAAMLSLPTLAFGGTTCKVRGSKVTFKIERGAKSQQTAFTGVVRDQSGNALPGVRISVRDETANADVSVVTDATGAFTIAGLNGGMYRIDVTLAGFASTHIEHLQLKTGEVTHARIALRVDYATITVGGLAPMITNDAGKTTLSGDVLNKLPF
jgi:hypothetical protein